MAEEDYILTFALDDGREVAASFKNMNDRDGCDISLDMYRVNLGPITQEVWERIVRKSNGTLLG